MRNVVSNLRIVWTLAFIVAFGSVGYGQGGPTSSLSGVVFDASGAVIPGAEIGAKNNATAAQVKAISAENGTFSIPAMDPGAYTVTVSLPGFKQAVLNNVKLDAGVPATVRATLEVGGATETVEVQIGAEILQSQTANICFHRAVQPDLRPGNHGVFGFVQHAGPGWTIGSDRRPDHLVGD